MGFSFHSRVPIPIGVSSPRFDVGIVGDWLASRGVESGERFPWYHKLQKKNNYSIVIRLRHCVGATETSVHK